MWRRGFAASPSPIPGSTASTGCWASCSADRQRHREAVEVLRRGAELAPAEGLLQWKLALALQSAGDRRAAETCLSRALELGLPDPLRSQAALLLRALGKSGH